MASLGKTLTRGLPYGNTEPESQDLGKGKYLQLIFAGFKCSRFERRLNHSQAQAITFKSLLSLKLPRYFC